MCAYAFAIYIFYLCTDPMHLHKILGSSKCADLAQLNRFVHPAWRDDSNGTKEWVEESFLCGKLIIQMHISSVMRTVPQRGLKTSYPCFPPSGHQPLRDCISLTASWCETESFVVSSLFPTEAAPSVVAAGLWLVLVLLLAFSLQRLCRQKAGSVGSVISACVEFTAVRELCVDREKVMMSCSSLVLWLW